MFIISHDLGLQIHLRLHYLHKVRLKKRISSGPHQRRGQVEDSFQHPQQTLRISGYTFWVDYRFCRVPGPH